MFKKGIPIVVLAWLALLLPLVTIHLSYLISASFEHVPWCFPYWDSCTSISATGRKLPEKLIFKFGMISAAFNAILLWWSAGQWCRLSGIDHSVRARRTMQLLGMVAAFFMIQYTLALGEAGDTYRMLRRSGVVLTFSLTYMAQVLLTRFVGEIAERQGNRDLTRLHQRMLILLVVLLSTGILSLILEAFWEPRHDQVEDAFEWVMALMLYSYFGLLAWVWHRQPVNLTIGYSR